MNAADDPLCALTAHEAVKKIRLGELTSRELAEACLRRIHELEPRLKAWVFHDPDKVRAQAWAFDQTEAQRRCAYSLGGIPIGIKDIFNTSDAPTAMGSPIWKDFTPGNDARSVFYLRQAGAIVMGKTVTAEFAVHAPGPTVNPHHAGHIPGTSSSGSAVAVAANMVPCAIGTQTAGSVIRPASYCGVYGMKPSFGLIPRTGMLKTTDSLDTVGFFARDAEDLGILLDAMRVHGLDYPISHSKLTDSPYRNKARGKWRVAVVETPVTSLAEKYALDALAHFAGSLSMESDVELNHVRLPVSFGSAHEVHAMIYDRSLAYYFKNEYQEKTLISREIKSMIEHGNTVSLEDFKKAVSRQNVLAHELDQLLAGYDIWITLSTTGEAPKIGIDEKPDSCLIWTLCGVPAINIPAMTGPTGLPIGLQAVSRRYSDMRLLRFAKILEQRFVKSAVLSKGAQG